METTIEPKTLETTRTAATDADLFALLRVCQLYGVPVLLIPPDPDTTKLLTMSTNPTKAQAEALVRMIEAS